MASIADIRLRGFEYAIPDGEEYGIIRGLSRKRNCSVIELTLDDGTVGYGEAGGPARQLNQHLALIRSFLVGTSPFDFDIVTTQIYQKLYHFGLQNMITACLSGISVAVHDAIGKRLGLPIHDLIGGKSAQGISCYATTGYFSAGGLADYERQLETLDRNFRGVKIKIGAGIADDIDRVRRARAILGDDILLMVDINANYTPDIALECIRRIEKYDIHWCEEPLPPTDERGYAELRARSPMPIATGEALYTVHDFKRLIETRAVDVIQPSLIAGGGLSQCKAIALLAQIANLRVSPSIWGGGLAIAAGLHFTTSLPVWPHTDHAPYPLMIEYDLGASPFRERMTPVPTPDAAGMLPVPTGPGLGVSPDFDAVAEFAIPL